MTSQVNTHSLYILTQRTQDSTDSELIDDIRQHVTQHDNHASLVLFSEPQGQNQIFGEKQYIIQEDRVGQAEDSISQISYADLVSLIFVSDRVLVL